MIKDSDDEEESQVAKWSGNIVLPKLEDKPGDSAMVCGDWIARITAVMGLTYHQEVPSGGNKSRKMHRVHT